MRLYLLVFVALFFSCNSNNNAQSKNLSHKDSIRSSAKLDDPNSDSSDITNPLIFDFAKETHKIITDKRSQMRGIKLSFDVPVSWTELKSKDQKMAYHFFNKDLNTDLQIGISPPSNDSDITEGVKYQLEGIFPGFLYDRRIKIAGKNALQMNHARTIQINNSTSYVNTLSVVFFHKTQLIIFTYGNAKINKEESIENILDFRILYHHLAKSIEIIE